MEIIPKKIVKTSKGWKFSFLINLTPIEFSKYNSKIKKCGIYFKEYQISTENDAGDKLMIEREIKIMEPWEDETPDAILESLKVEIKGLFNRTIFK